MAGYGGKQTAVGTLVDPTEGITASLNNLSNMYGQQVDRETQAKIQADAQALRLKQELRSQTTFDNAENKRAANVNFNKYAMSGEIKNHKYSINDLNAESSKYLLNGQKAIMDERGELLAGIDSGSYDTKLFRKHLEATPLSKSAVENRVAERKKAMSRAAAELRGTTPEERKLGLDKYADNLYAPRLQSIQNDIVSGKHLSNTERVNAVLRSMDPNMVGNLDYSNASQLLAGKVGGLTDAGIQASEATRVKDANEATKFNISNELSVYNKVYGSRNKNSPDFTGKDLDNYVTQMDGLDIGWWVDNPNAKAAGAKLLALGHHPSAVVATIKNNINSGIDNTFFDPEKETKKFEELSKQSARISGSLIKDRVTGNTKVDKPGKYTPAVARSIDTIRKMAMRYGSDLRLKNFVPGDASVSDVNSALTSGDRVLPRNISALPGVNSEEKQSLFGAPGEVANPVVDTADVTSVDYAKQIQDYMSLPGNERARAFSLLPPEVKQAVMADNKSKSFWNTLGQHNTIPNEYGEVTNTAPAASAGRQSITSLLGRIGARGNKPLPLTGLGFSSGTGNNRSVLDRQAAGINTKNARINGKYTDEYITSQLENTPAKLNGTRTKRIPGPNNNRAVLDAQAEGINKKNTRITDESLIDLRNTTGGVRLPSPVREGKLDVSSAKAEYDKLNKAAEKLKNNGDDNNNEDPDTRSRRIALGLLLDGRSIDDIKDGPMKRELARFINQIEEEYYG